MPEHRPALRRQHHRHPGRRPARPHAGARRGAARAQDPYLFREPDAPAFDVSAFSTVGSFDDEAALSAFAATVDVVTYEFENVPAGALQIAGTKAPVHPPAESARRRPGPARGEGLHRAGSAIPVADYADVHDERSLRDALTHVRLPAILKTRRFGYDGKGQALVRSEAEALGGAAAISAVSLLARSTHRLRARDLRPRRARPGRRAQILRLPVENVHENGILAVSRVPARIDADCALEARRIAGSIAEALDHVGVLVRGDVPARGRAPAPAGQRDRAAGAQFRPLDHRRLPLQPIREPCQGDSRLAAWRHGAPQRCGDDQSDRRRGGALARAWRAKRASRCISMARPRRGQAARWATPPGSFPRVHDTASLDNQRLFC